MQLSTLFLELLIDFYYFFKNLAVDIAANCICEIHCSLLDEINLNIIHKLSSKDKKLRQSRDSNQGLVGGKQDNSVLRRLELLD